MRRALFLDRDGTINVERPDYVKNWNEFVFLPDVLDALAELSGIDADIVVVTNQSAVGRGIVSLEVVKHIHEHMTETISAAGGRLDAIYLCPHTPWDVCSCRKPRPGMLKIAAQERGLDLSTSILVGDHPTDVEAGRAAGCRTLFLDRGSNAAGLASVVETIERDFALDVRS